MRGRLRLKEGWSTYFLLILMYVLAVWCLDAANWADGAGLLIWVVFVAVTVGLALAKLKWLPGVIAHVLATVLGLLWTLFIVSQLLPGELTTKERVIVLVERFISWFTIAIGEGVNADNVMFILQLGALLWLFSYLGAWFAFRRQQVWPGIIPAGIIILVNNHYSSAGLTVYFVLFLFCALLFIVRVRVLAEQLHWQDQRIAFAPDIAIDFLRDGALLSVMIVLAAVFLPGIMAKPSWSDVWNRFSEPWQTVQTEWSRLYGALRAPSTPQGIAFGHSLALGGSVNLSDTPFMVVQAPEATYWRAVVYDRYTGRGWINTDNNADIWPAEENWPVAAFDATEEMTYTVKPLQPALNQIYTAGQPVRASIPVRADLSYIRMEQDGLTVAGIANPSVLHAGQSIPRDGYTVVSLMSTASAPVLKQAGTQYPAWVLERYLSLPSSIHPEVEELARELTRDATNPYDAAATIESFLRREYTYSRSIEPPPSGQDAVSYFLLQSKVGYCDYYASAMVVMLRSVGIPARVASGYAPGSWDSLRQGYTVLYSDAHSWPEVFFPNYGWIAFEPTSSQPLINRPPAEETGLINGNVIAPLLRRFEEEDKFAPDEMFLDDEVASGGLDAPSGGGAWSLPAIAAVAFAFLLVVAAAVGRILYLRRMKPAERLFARMRWLARLAGVRRREWETPREFALRLGEVLGRCQSDALFFANLYNEERFGVRKETALDEERARAHWSRLYRAIAAHQWRRIQKRLTPKPRPSYERIPISRL